MKSKIILMLSIIIMSCSSDDDSTQALVNNTPVMASYIQPTNNQTCTGTIVSPTTIQVSFEWNLFQDSEDNSLNYLLEVTNQNTNTVAIEQNLTTTSSLIILDKDTTYSWNVTATDSDGASVTGLTWQFQTPSEAVSNYAPFPANLISPNNGDILTNNNVTLTWEGNDPDTGETSQLLYDVYLGTTNPPSLVSSDQISESYTETLALGTYYWMVSSKDPNNNSSNSQIRQFSVN